MRSELLRGVGHGGALVSSATNGAGSLVYNHYGNSFQRNGAGALLVFYGILCFFSSQSDSQADPLEA